MDFDAFVEFITPLAMHFGAVKDGPTWQLYHAALMAPPAPSRALLDRALLRAANRRFFPTTEELRADAEAERQDILARHPYGRCAACRDNSGWVEVLVDNVPRMQRCDCWARYQANLEQLGVSAAPLMLPAGVAPVWED